MTYTCGATHKAEKGKANARPGLVERDVCVVQQVIKILLHLKARRLQKEVPQVLWSFSRNLNPKLIKT